MYKNNPPVQEGQIIKHLKIEAIGNKGDGITRINGFVVIVPESKKGETHNVKITKVLPKLAFAEVII